MYFEIHKMQPSEYPELEDYLYRAIFVPEGTQPPPRKILQTPELQVYIKNFGEGRADFAYAATFEDNNIGAIWSRLMNDYGHIDDETPSIALSVQESFRRAGVATALIQTLVAKLKAENFRQVSLAVQKENFGAVNLYKKMKFKIFSENNSEYIMKLDWEV